MKCQFCADAKLIYLGSTKCEAVYSYRSHQRNILRCVHCDSLWITPRPLSGELEEYYQKYAASDKDPDRKDPWDKRTSFKIIRDLCLKLKSGKILDIGCADGSLLARLPDSFEKFGIDISGAACQLVDNPGITVICSSFETVDLSAKFRLIIALDFLEHLSDPVAVLKKIYRLLVPGGYLIVETGDATSYCAKWLRADWSYTAVYGHLSVISMKKLRELACQENFRPILMKRIWHIYPGMFRMAYRNILAYGFHLFRILFRLLYPVSGKFINLKKLYRHSPPGAYHRDHIIFIGQKK